MQSFFVPCEGMRGQDCFVGVEVLGNGTVGIIRRKHPGVSAEAVAHVLRQHGVNVFVPLQ